MSVLDLARTLAAEEIGRVRAEGWSGVLALTQGEVAKSLYFVDGAITFGASSVEEDRLGACLFRAGRITQSQFHEAMRESEASGRPLGRALVDLGHLAPADLAAAVAAQIERIVLSVLRWTTGSLRREPMDTPLPSDLALDINTSRLLLLGSRQFPDVDRLERALGAPARRVRRVTPWPFDYDQVPSSPAERAVLALSARSVPLGDLLALPHPRPELVRSIYALLAAGLVQDAPPGASVAPPPPPRTPEDAERAARGYLEKGLKPRAIEVLQEALDRHPEATGLRRLLAMTRGRESDFQPEVEKLFLTLLEKEPRDTELRYALASYYRRAGRAARAMLHLRLVLSADSGHAAARRDLGDLEAGEARRGR